jgi:anti-sigma B factor antagonist
LFIRRIDMLNINKNAAGSNLTVSLEGRLDTTTAPQLEEELKSSLDGVTDLVIDIKDTQYISSAGLRVLLSAQKTMNKQGKMVVKNPSEEVKEIFDVTGFSDILTIE